MSITEKLSIVFTYIIAACGNRSAQITLLLRKIVELDKQLMSAKIARDTDAFTFIEAEMKALVAISQRKGLI